MPIIRWRPFHDLEELFEDSRQHNHHAYDLAVDVLEDENNVIVHMNLPGIDADKVDIEVEDNYLKVSGSREQETETEDKNYYHKEIRRGHFERVIALPASVVVGEASAVCDNGVLKITLPKIKKKIPSKIKVTKK